MSFSGTVSQTAFNTRQVIDHAMRRCKLTAGQISGEYLDIALDQLYLLLSSLANQGAPLWCQEKAVYPLYQGVNYVTTYSGTVDILNANLRTLLPASGTVSSTSTSYTSQFASAASVSSVGIKWSAASVPVQLQRSDNGSLWTVVQTETRSVGAGEWTWFDLDSVVPSLYFRIVATTGTLSFSDIYLGNSPTEIPIARINKDDYFNLPNKTSTGDKPLQYWCDRKALSPVLRIWPAPTATSEHYQIVALAHRHIMDVGPMSISIEVPQRWLDAIIALLAARLAMEIPEVDAGLIPVLDSKAAQFLNEAQEAESDDSPIHWLPDISAYTA